MTELVGNCFMSSVVTIFLFSGTWKEVMYVGDRSEKSSVLPIAKKLGLKFSQLTSLML